MEKIKTIGYMTKEEKERIQKRARQMGMTIGGYLAEMAMWESRFTLLPQLRKGGNIICNGKAQS